MEVAGQAAAAKKQLAGAYRIVLCLVLLRVVGAVCV
jgi:hypothetical protein